MNNFEKIKQMNIDEMAEHHELFARSVLKSALLSFGLNPVNVLPPLNIKRYYQWLQEESEDK